MVLGQAAIFLAGLSSPESCILWKSSILSVQYRTDKATEKSKRERGSCRNEHTLSDNLAEAAFGLEGLFQVTGLS